MDLGSQRRQRKYLKTKTQIRDIKTRSQMCIKAKYEDSTVHCIKIEFCDYENQEARRNKRQGDMALDLNLSIHFKPSTTTTACNCQSQRR